MAAHTKYPPAGADPLVRGDPATWVVRIQKGGVDQDITGWTWRSYVRNKIDGEFINECLTFTTKAPADLPDLFSGDPSTVPCVLLLDWTPDQTAEWMANFVADIEQLTPAKRTWLIIDGLNIDKDVSYEPGEP